MRHRVHRPILRDRVRGAAGRTAAALLLVLHTLIGVAVVVADGQPASGHARFVAGAVRSAPASAADPVEWLSGPHDCLFCDYLAAHQTAAPELPSVTLPVASLVVASAPVSERPRSARSVPLPPARAPPVA